MAPRDAQDNRDYVRDEEINIARDQDEQRFQQWAYYQYWLYYVAYYQYWLYYGTLMVRINAAMTLGLIDDREDRIRSIGEVRHFLVYRDGTIRPVYFDSEPMLGNSGRIEDGNIGC